MPPRTPTRRFQQPLRVHLLARSYDTLQFHADKRAFSDPGSNEEVTSVSLDLNQTFDGEGPTTPFPLRFRITRWESKPFVTRYHDKTYVPGKKSHSLQRLEVPVYDARTRAITGTKDVTCAKASWAVDHAPSSPGSGTKKVIHRDGQIQLYAEDSDSGTPTVRCRYVDDFIKRLGGDQYMLSIPQQIDLRSINYMMAISACKKTQVLVMDLTAPDNSHALKFTLTLPVEDIQAEGTLEIRSRGLDYPVSHFPHLRGMILALWLVHSGEESTYFEKWQKDDSESWEI